MSSLRAADGLLLMASLLLASAPAARASTPSPPQTLTMASSPSASEPCETVEVINGSVREIKTFHAVDATRPSRRAHPAPRGTRVEVINGNTERTVVLAPPPGEASWTRTARRPRHRGKTAANRSPLVTAEILNGTERSTQVFHPAARSERATAIARNRPAVVVGVASSGSQNAGQPVVIGIAAAGSRTGLGQAKPVVLRVASSGSESESGSKEPVVVGIESNGVARAGADADPVAIGVSPHPPKRPLYRRPNPSP